MWVFQFRELGKGLHYLVCTLTAGSDNHNVCLCLLRDRVLEHGLTCTERTRDKSCTTLADWVSGVDCAHTCLKQLEWTWFALVCQYWLLHWPLLYHGHIVVIALGVSQDSDGVVNLVLASSHDALHGVCAFEYEWHHDLVWLVVLIYLTQPCSSFHFVAYLCDWLKLP